MNWFRENRFLGGFLILFSLGALGAVWFLLGAKKDWDGAVIHFNETTAELNRLERLAPYPSGENLRKVQIQVEAYAKTLTKFKDELKAHVVLLQPLAPNEFQSRLRLAMTAMAEKAKAKKITLPDRFYLGFDEFASALPNAVAAPLLGQELGQIEWLLDTLFEGPVDALTSFRRAPVPQEFGITSPGSTPASRKKEADAMSSSRVIERNVVEATFVSTPAAARKVLNQITGADKQFFIVRRLRVRNQKDKGPLREGATDAVPTASSAPQVGAPEKKPAATTPLNFIVGNEHIEVTAQIEIVRFIF